MPNILHYRVTGLRCIVLAISLALFQSNAFAKLIIISGPAIVTDGDTLKIRNYKIRLHGIDAPELRQFCHDKVTQEPVQCGITAKKALSTELNNNSVKCISTKKDIYKRYVAECYQGKTNINAWLVKNGWAVDWPKYSQGAYASEQVAAKNSNAGIWAYDFIYPWDFRRKQKR